MPQTTTKKFLLVKHSEGWNVDRCSRWMRQNGTAFDMFYPTGGHAFPDARDYAGVIVFGGAPSANDTDQRWVRDELNFIESCLDSNVAFFGICLGAQMLASVLGARVTTHPDDETEIGFYEVKPTDSGKDFLQQPLKFMQWHREGFELPSGAVHLAHNEIFENQAFSIGKNIVGVQFHPEVNLDVLRIWHERNKTRPAGVLDDATRAAHLADAHVCEQPVNEWLDDFMDGWTGIACQAD